jgi:hypothetical protein
MKFKTIFILFNVVIVFSFLFIFFMPLTVLGWDYAQLFWSRNWILAVLFVAVMVGINAYFFSQWRLFMLLESENWQGLIHYLEERIYDKKRIRPQHVRILINTYVVTSRLDAIEKLEGFLVKHRPDLVSRFALQLGVPYLLKNQADTAERFFSGLLENPRVKRRNWIRWTHAFAVLLQQKQDDAKERLKELVPDVKDPVLLVLALYLLEAFTKSDEEAGRLVESNLAELKQKYTQSQWSKEADKRKNEIHVLLLSKLLQEASDWAFSIRDGVVVN